MRIFALVLSLALFACRSEEPASHGDHAASPQPLPMPTLAEDARVFFVTPSNGAVVRGPLVDGKVEVKFEMGAKGVAIEPAGEVKDGSGHHHILVDVEDVPFGVAVPADEKHIHFGKAQTEAVLPLAPGEHRLTLQLADGAHRSYGPELKDEIRITVEAEEAAEAEKAEEAEDQAEAE
ncbi:MAG: DUF4399 domain-containing protein [Myxococcales bacterium]|jgi:hypothetical protein|nr:DUF4399 domain-containing protein [Myxococcales bacterium]